MTLAMEIGGIIFPMLKMQQAMQNQHLATYNHLQIKRESRNGYDEFYTFADPLSIVHCPLSIVHCPLSVVHCPLSTVNRFPGIAPPAHHWHFSGVQNRSVCYLPLLPVLLKVVENREI